MHIYQAFIFPLIFAFSEAQLYLTNSNVTEVCEFQEDSCTVHFDSKKIEKLLEKESQKITIIDNDEFAAIKGTCLLSSRFWNEKYGFIYPGTLWCGRGTKATEFSQLGVHSKEDSCCRDHDNCPSSLAAGQCRSGICNDSRFTRSHCECDRKFQECLRNSGTETGNLIGAIFFNIAQIFCFSPTPNCPERERVVFDGENATSPCPFEFLPSDKIYIQGPGSSEEKTTSKPPQKHLKTTSKTPQNRLKNTSKAPQNHLNPPQNHLKPP
ncbi:Phospholipase A2 [Popillia japonica]|uniref:phospholipase A2 n=1 Tax=Popillia japonica TaxID=7064 RepID=A0AAW1MNT8_POPJA